jgi:hypothetical protein
MNPEEAIFLAALAFGSMAACWHLGYQSGQKSVLKEFESYCDRRDAGLQQPRRNNRQTNQEKK